MAFNLTTVINEAMGLIASAHTGLVYKIGGDLLFEQDAPPRVVWVPTADSFAGPKMQKVEPRALRTRRAGVVAYCWDVDFAATELLVNDVIGGMHITAHGAYDVVSGEWTTQTKDQLGRAYAISFVVEIPITMPAVGSGTPVTLNTESQNVGMTFPSGSTVSGVPGV